MVPPPTAAAVERAKQRAADETAACEFLLQVITGRVAVISNHSILRSRVNHDATRPRWVSDSRRRSAAVLVHFQELATIQRLVGMLKRGKFTVEDLEKFTRSAKRWLQPLYAARIDTAISRFRDENTELLAILADPSSWGELGPCETIAQAVKDGTMAALYQSGQVTDETYFRLIENLLMGKNCGPVYAPSPDDQEYAAKVTTVELTGFRKKLDELLAPSQR